MLFLGTKPVLLVAAGWNVLKPAAGLVGLNELGVNSFTEALIFGACPAS
jgi:hypothetical protein